MAPRTPRHPERPGKPVALLDPGLLLLVPSIAVLALWGVSLLAFAILLALATLNKWRLAPRIGAGDGAAAAAFRRSVLAEWLLIAGVLAATAIMTGYFSPA